MTKLKNGYGQPIVTHLMATDACNFKCAFCSVQHRAGDSLTFKQIDNYISQLIPLGLKSVILSGGGNPILYRDGDKNFNTLVLYLYLKGLEIGLITNGTPLVEVNGRKTWKGVDPNTLDMLKWVRISLSGWDHTQDRIDTPDFDQSVTTLGGSYVLHDIYDEPADKKHHRVSTKEDLITSMNRPLDDLDPRPWPPCPKCKSRERAVGQSDPQRCRYCGISFMSNGQIVQLGSDRLPRLKEQMKEWADRYHPRYVRLLPNCLEPSLIPERARILQEVADEIDPSVFFVQVKPPRQPHRCLKGYPHPVANCDGWVYPCDSVVLNQTAGHKFGSAWRICKMEDIGKFYSEPIRPNVANNICPGCVFSDQVDLISNIADGKVNTTPTGPEPEHINFV
jgi:hypothetical protein